MCANFPEEVHIKKAIAYKLAVKINDGRFFSFWRNDCAPYQKDKQFRNNTIEYGFHAYQFLEDVKEVYNSRGFLSPRVIIKVLLEDIKYIGRDGSFILDTDPEAINEPPIYIADYQTVLEQVYSKGL